MTITDFLQLGSTKIRLVASKLENIFWRQVLTLTDKFLRGGIFCSPHRIFLTPLWDNPFILLDGKPIPQNKFASLGQKLKYIYEFYDPLTGSRKTSLDINRMYKTKLTQDQALIGVGLQKNCPFEYQAPIRPALLEIANLTGKGSKPFYNLIRAKNTLRIKST